MQQDIQGQRFAKYQLGKTLGEGGFARVYRATDLESGKEVALKIFKGLFPDQTSLDELSKEAEITKNLDHPHIVRVHRFAIEGNVPYLVMDYISYSWRDKHALGTPLPLDLVVKYSKQLSAALQYAHDRRVVHRDLKPANLLLNQQGDLLLGDFGIARVLTSSGFDYTQHLSGTLQYMAPEAFEGAIERACDQYSLGIIVYEWLTGKRPFEGTFTELMQQHIYVTPGSLRRLVPSLSPEVEQAVLQALAKKPHQRFQSVQAFATKLEQAVYPQAAKLAAPAQSPSKSPPPAQPAPANPPAPLAAPGKQAAPAQPAQPPAKPAAQAPAWPAGLPPSPVQGNQSPAPLRPVNPPAGAPGIAPQQPPIAPPAQQGPGRTPPSGPAAQPASPPPAPTSPPAPPLAAQLGAANPSPHIGIGPAIQGQPRASGPAQAQHSPASPPGPKPPVAGPQVGSAPPAQTPQRPGIGSQAPAPQRPGPGPQAPAQTPQQPPAGSRPAGPQQPPGQPAAPGAGGLQQPPAPGSGGFQQPAIQVGPQNIRPTGQVGSPPPPQRVSGGAPFPPAGANPPTGTAGGWIAGGPVNYNAPTIPAKGWSGGSQTQPAGPSVPLYTLSETAQPGTRTRIYPAHTSPIKEIYWFTYGNQILSLDEHMAHSWEASLGTPGAPATMTPRNSIWSPDRAYVASIDTNGITIYDMLRQPPAQVGIPYQGHQGDARTVAWLFGGSHLASSGNDRTVHIWEAATGKLIRDPYGSPYLGIYQAHVRPVTHLAPSPDGKLIASAEEGGNIQVWNPRNGETVNGYAGHQEKLRYQGNISALEWSPGGMAIASQAGREVRVWDIASGKTFAVREGVAANQLILWSPDGKRIASRGTAGRGSIDIWDASTGKTLLTCDCGDAFSTLAWSPSGKTLAAGAGRTVQLWDARSGKRLLSYPGHASPVTAIAWSRDGKQIASGDSGDQAAAQTGHAINAQVHIWQTAGVELTPWQVYLYRILKPFDKAQRKLGKGNFWLALALAALDIAAIPSLLITFYASLAFAWLLLALVSIALVIWGLLSKKRLKRTLFQAVLIPLVVLWAAGGWSLGTPVSIAWLSAFVHLLAMLGCAGAAAWLHRKVLQKL